MSRRAPALNTVQPTGGIKKVRSGPDFCPPARIIHSLDTPRRQLDPSTAAKAQALLADASTALEDYFHQVMNRYGQAPQRLCAAVAYSLEAGGKRLRPALILQCYQACRRPDAPPQSASALACAGAMELIHTFSLVHDDLPAMDDDDLRRGRPTNHKVFGEAMAILAGDAMVAMAFEILARDAEPPLVATLVRELAAATGPLGMIGGQVLDMQGEGQKLDMEQLQNLHRMKTGALLLTSCRMGALCASADALTLDRISRFGAHLGLAFQIVDDLLDLTATAGQMGKATGKDAAKGKNTYPGLLGMEASGDEAKRQLHAALEAIAPLGQATEPLATLAGFVVQRNH